MQLRLPGMDRVADLLLLAPFVMPGNIPIESGFAEASTTTKGLHIRSLINPAYLLMRAGVPFDEKSLAHYALTR